MAMEEDCNIGLALGLASYGDQNLLDHRHRSSSDHHHQHQKTNNKSLKFDHVLPSLSLGLVEAGSSSCQSVLPSAAKIEDKGEARSNLDHELCRQNSSISPGSSYSNDSSTVKKEKDGGGDYGGEEGEVEKGWSRPVTAVNSDEDEEGSPRKKLRLTKEQAAVLEDSFKEHSTLNPNQKQALAKRLNLRPRQVEVWFQNRRARTKLKQTEMDCELLKKYCQTLREENKRLQKELQELKALKLPAAVPSPVYMQVPAATLSMCPSCERIISSSAALVNDGSTTTRARGPAALTIYSKQASQLCNPFSHPSAAC